MRASDQRNEEDMCLCSPNRSSQQDRCSRHVPCLAVQLHRQPAPKVQDHHLHRVWSKFGGNTHVRFLPIITCFSASEHGLVEPEPPDVLCPYGFCMAYLAVPFNHVQWHRLNQSGASSQGSGNDKGGAYLQVQPAQLAPEHSILLPGSHHNTGQCRAWCGVCLHSPFWEVAWVRNCCAGKPLRANTGKCPGSPLPYTHPCSLTGSPLQPHLAQMHSPGNMTAAGQVLEDGWSGRCGTNRHVHGSAVRKCRLTGCLDLKFSCCRFALHWHLTLRESPEHVSMCLSMYIARCVSEIALESYSATQPSQDLVYCLQSNFSSQCDAEAVWVGCRLMTVSWTTAQNPPPQYVQVSMTARPISCTFVQQLLKIAVDVQYGCNIVTWGGVMVQHTQCRSVQPLALSFNCNQGQFSGFRPRTKNLGRCRQTDPIICNGALKA